MRVLRFHRRIIEENAAGVKRRTSHRLESILVSIRPQAIRNIEAYARERGLAMIEVETIEAARILSKRNPVA